MYAGEYEDFQNPNLLIHQSSCLPKRAASLFFLEGEVHNPNVINANLHWMLEGCSPFQSQTSYATPWNSPELPGYLMTYRILPGDNETTLVECSVECDMKQPPPFRFFSSPLLQPPPSTQQHGPRHSSGPMSFQHAKEVTWCSNFFCGQYGWFLAPLIIHWANRVKGIFHDLNQNKGHLHS